MSRQTKNKVRLTLPLLIVASAAIMAPTGVSAQANGYENLQALPTTISRDDLGDAMLAFLRALGLPRRAGEGCLHCHEGDLEVPRSQWDYASDAKPTKRTARRMIEMVRGINSEYLGSLEQRRDASFAVGCITCHDGRLDPRPLPLLLAEAEEAAGLDSVVTLYRTLHRRHYGSSAYDLRVGVLAGLAQDKAEAGAFDDALQLAELNEETHGDDPAARRVTLGLLVLRALDTSGAEEAIAVFDGLLQSEDPAVLTYGVLDGVGWRTYRLDRHTEALALFERNRRAFPELYFTFESLVEAQHGAGQISRDEIIGEYEAFLTQNPDHPMAQQQLTNHRRRN